MRQSDIRFKVVKNTLSKLAARDTDIGPASSMFKGPVAVIYSTSPEQSIYAVKKVVDFNKDNENLTDYWRSFR